MKGEEYGIRSHPGRHQHPHGRLHLLRHHADLAGIADRGNSEADDECWECNERPSNKLSTKTGAVWSRPEVIRLVRTAGGRPLLGHARPEHSGCPHADARGAASSLHTRRRGSFFFFGTILGTLFVKRETLFVKRGSGGWKAKGKGCREVMGDG